MGDTSVVRELDANEAGCRCKLVGAGRFELPTSWSQTRRPAAGPRPGAGRISLIKMSVGETCGTPGENRTLVSGSGGQHSNPLSYGGLGEF